MKYPDGRAPTRGDYVGAHHLCCDALEGVWWNNDCQIRRILPGEEFLQQEFSGVLFIAGPAEMEPL